MLIVSLGRELRGNKALVVEMINFRDDGASFAVESKRAALVEHASLFSHFELRTRSNIETKKQPDSGRLW
jgi:hypothetical protein